jgi:hypothetical protein
MYSPGSSQIGWSLGATSKMVLNSAGLTVVNGVGGGNF